MMEAGRELDALIAEKVFGLKLDWEMTEECGHIALDGKCPKCITITADHPYDIPEYSTDIAAAWTVVEKISPGKVFELCKEKDGSYNAAFYQEAYHGMLGLGKADTAPLAICLASLAAIEKK